ncbi:DinB family protein [Zhouia sp. PK063]|uniref:DinB family protein n=1 Tax=Zhouia sp. PK063 TaxID=3373602 RepID=UPI00379C3E70
MNTNETAVNTTVITKTELLAHWQGHRALTRRVIEVFPEDEFFDFKIGEMRTFSAIVKELLAIAGPGIKEIVTGKTSPMEEDLALKTKADFLKLWDETTEVLNELFPTIADQDFHKTIKTFGQYDGTVISSIFYFIDNEIHHRGQGYVYLRSLGIEPPYFWER